MSENIHPGHKVLREVCPETEYRRMLVAALCGKIDRETYTIDAKTTRRVMLNWSVEHTPEQAAEIAAFINSI